MQYITVFLFLSDGTVLQIIVVITFSQALFSQRHRKGGHRRHVVEFVLRCTQHHGGYSETCLQLTGPHGSKHRPGRSQSLWQTLVLSFCCFG